MKRSHSKQNDPTTKRRKINLRMRDSPKLLVNSSSTSSDNEMNSAPLLNNAPLNLSSFKYREDDAPVTRRRTVTGTHRFNTSVNNNPFAQSYDDSSTTNSRNSNNNNNSNTSNVAVFSIPDLTTPRFNPMLNASIPHVKFAGVSRAPAPPVKRRPHVSRVGLTDRNAPSPGTFGSFARKGCLSTTGSISSSSSSSASASLHPTHNIKQYGRTISSQAVPDEMVMHSSQLTRRPSASVGRTQSRYCEDFVELAIVGSGSSGVVFKVRKKIDGCMYAVKRVEIGPTGKAQMREVFALAATNNDVARVGHSRSNSSSSSSSSSGFAIGSPVVMPSQRRRPSQQSQQSTDRSMDQSTDQPIEQHQALSSTHRTISDEALSFNADEECPKQILRYFNAWTDDQFLYIQTELW